ncbi:unnamed protein product [Fusarium langsethiae]|nr:unnamed protein product [Fusarium langsethiae]
MALRSHSFLLPLVKSGEYSDFSLTCNGEIFKLHQVIVCPQSPVITTALRGCFLEATSIAIAVNGFDLSTVRYTISFLYTGKYELCTKNECKSDSDNGYNQDNTDPKHELSSALPELAEDGYTEILLSHLRVNAIADFYDIQKLVQLANSKIRVILEEDPDAHVLPRIIREVSACNRDSGIRSIIASAAVTGIEEHVTSEAYQDLELEHNLSGNPLRL